VHRTEATVAIAETEIAETGAAVKVASGAHAALKGRQAVLEAVLRADSADRRVALVVDLLVNLEGLRAVSAVIAAAGLGR
jgi:hypothetical protein